MQGQKEGFSNGGVLTKDGMQIEILETQAMPWKYGLFIDKEFPCLFLQMCIIF